jgi:uncharacterized protein (DUF1697 family)
LDLARKKSRNTGRDDSACFYAAFLRGVSPMNLRMKALTECLEDAGYANVKTLLSSGNVVFSTTQKAPTLLEGELEAAMQEHLGRTFPVHVRSASYLAELVATDPYAAFRLGTLDKRVVTFLRESPRKPPRLPVELDGARILAIRGTEVFTAYVPNPRGPVFMTLLEKTFGKDVTTRTWDTVLKAKVAASKRS